MKPEDIFRPFRVKDLIHVIADKELTLQIVMDGREIDYEDLGDITKAKDALVGAIYVLKGHTGPGIRIECSDTMEYVITPHIPGK